MPTRNRFALRGRSVQIDPRRDAARRDLADVRLADRIFAPHYAAPLFQRAVQETPIRAGRDPESEAIAALPAGAEFEVLEISGGLAWGRAPSIQTVGYVDASALGIAA
ncbi:hypothetical protein J2Y54_000498 [Sphingomonas sp. BE123]|uniref:SH3 domain-containing protein n=1 Tax=unclassified Sphingomonas TaxID=196159 RepID=UPI0028651C3A|nr:SH3 domain-containing protein [Sphingomonas sp. BE123]MDR6851005.1 hypothetical protein [Sphingomonas sp. BE123]